MKREFPGLRERAEDSPSMIEATHKWLKRMLPAGGLLVLMMVALTPSLHAQFKASLRGTVTDPSGAVIPGAKVTLKDKQTNQVRTATANASGVYTFNFLPPDSFELTVEHPGFQKKVISDVAITPDQSNALNVAMEVGQVQQTVTVSGTTSALNTDSATISQTLTSNQIQHLPAFDRNVFALAELTPGVFGDASQSATGGSYSLPGNQGPGGPGTQQAGIFQTENGPQIQAQGGQYETNGISIDGINTNSAVWGGTTVITPSLDSVQSMKVVSNDYNAANGRFSGAQIDVTTKSGTNSLHGSFFFKAARPGLNAYQGWNGPASTNPGTPAQRNLHRDESRLNSYGGSLGGPIWKNRLFAFFNWESSPLSSSNPASGWYETPQFAQLTGTGVGPIATRYLTFPGEAPANATLVPETCAEAGLTQGVNCVEVSGGLNVGTPITTGIGNQDLTYGGNSTTPGVGGGLGTTPDIAFYSTTAPSTTSQNQYNGRLDANVTEKDHVAFTIYWQPVSATFYNGPARAANLWHKTTINDAFTVLWLHTFSPSLINQARANAAGWRWNEVATNPQEPFGLPQDNIDNIGGANVQFFGAPGPSHLDQWTYTYSDTLTKTIGNQNINVGGELTRLYYLNDPIYAARPQYYFHNMWTFLNDAPYKETGEFSSVTGIPFSNRQDERENLWGFFVQDDWKVMPNLTINAGLRWSYFGSYHSKQNNLDVLRFGTGSNPMDGIHMQIGGNLYNPPKTNFGPEIGFAWQPKMMENKLVFRGGFGMNYNQNEIAITANGFGNPPNAVQPTFNCAYPYTTANQNCAGTGILYETATDIHSIFGYPPNPAAITTFGSNNLPQTGSYFVTGYPKDPKTITTYHYSFGFEYQLPHHVVAHLGYQGTSTRNLLTQYNYNVVAGALGYALNPRVSYLDYYDNRAKSNYNGMIATLTHNFAHGFQLEGQYTWAKTMDEGSGPYSEDYYPFDAQSAYGRADFNVTNDFKMFGMWQPQLFRANSWMEKLVGGWTLTGVWNVHTGFPWSPNYSTNGSLYNTDAGYYNLRPMANLGGYKPSSIHDYEQATNPNFGTNGAQYFVAPTYTPGPAFPAFGTLPKPGMERNGLTGPGYNDLDGSLTKAFGFPKMPLLGNDAKLNVSAYVYNFLNEVNLGGVNSYLGSVSPTGVVNPNPNFGTVGGALGGRTVQLQARFSF
ncbi:MAG: carboxypeptidase regulatory-like domain-containing protein [Acidobacteriaceae bacterium]